MINVYLITNSINDKCYVGITKHDIKVRFDGHICDAQQRNSSTILHRAMRKYGCESFTIRLLEVVDNWESACQREKNLIAELHTKDHLCGYNMTDGGDGVIGYNHTDETKRKISESLKGFKRPFKSRKKGFKHSDETKRKFSEMQSGEKNHNWHKQKTDETKQKLLLSQPHRRRIEQLQLDGTFVAVYESQNSAWRATGVPFQNIYHCCRGHIKSAGGYVWKYVEEFTNQNTLEESLNVT